MDSLSADDGANAAHAPERTGSTSRLLEEIVVTAQKREENLADVPISVQAFSAASLDARGISDQAGLMKATPGLDVGSQAGFVSLFLRGIGTEAWLTADPSIASYVDGVYFPYAPSIVQQFGAVERVEVLKGPQGTLFGRNAVGGAISVITKAPDFDEQETEVETAIENFDTTRLKVYTNIPITDTFAMNMSAFYASGNPYLEGSTSGSPALALNEESSKGIRLKARWAPLDELDMTFGVVRTHAQNNGALPLNRNPSLLGKLAGVPPAGKYETHVDERLYLNFDTTVYQGEIVYNAPWFDLKLLASDQFNSQPYNYDFDGSERPLVSFDIPVHYGDIQEAEIQFLSNEGTPGSDWLTITAGVFLFKNEQGFDPIRVTVGNLNPTALAQETGLPVPPGLQAAFDNFYGAAGGFVDFLNELNAANPLLQPLELPPLPQADEPFYTVENTALVETDSLSEYLQVTAKLADWVSLTLGGRYQNEQRGVLKSDTNLQLLGDDSRVRLLTWTQARDADGRAVPLSDRTKKFSPKVSLDFHPFTDDTLGMGADTLLYASYQEATKAHAYNAYAIYLRPAYVKPENTTAYEVGLKTTLFDGLMRISTAAFFYEVKDLQTQFVSLVNGGAVSFENAGTAESKGFDFDIATEVFPSLIENLSMTFNGAFIDAVYTEYTSGSGYNPTTDIFSSNNDYTGNRNTRSPKRSGSIALTKLWNIPGGALEVGADYYYNSGFFYTASNDPDYEQPEYGLLGGFVGYTYEPWDARITVFGKNLTDEYYTAGIIATDFGSNYSVAPPLQYGVKLSISF
ncbi:MAG: TonB-dependent receptor [Panacagrimonas sp.]